MSLFKSLGFAIGIGFLASACAGQVADVPGDDGDESSIEDALKAKVTPGDFKLYADAHHHVNPGCDVHTQLSLTDGKDGSKATLREVVGGVCEIAVMENFRYYRLKASDGGCGAKIFKGSFTKRDGRHSISITDYRKFTCRMLIPAKIVVEETAPTLSGDIVTTKKYSLDVAASEAAVVTGTLVRTFGIGGENTGYSVSAASTGLTELVLDSSEAAQFVAGRTARVTGTWTLLSGVETRNRKAINVTDLLVCPKAGTINCMPGPDRPVTGACGEDHRWISENCPDVNFVY